MANLRRSALLLILIVACSSETGPPGEDDPDAMPPSSQPDPPEAAELGFTNQARADNGRAALTWSSALGALAEAHSKDMCDRDFFSHDNPDGKSPFDRMTAAGISYGRAAENIAGGNSDPQATHLQWMNSAGHRANILDANLKKIGIGYVPCNGRNLWTQAFTD